MMLSAPSRNRPSYAPFAEIDVPFERLVGGRRPLFVRTSGSDDMDDYELAESVVYGLKFALLKLAGRPGTTTLLLLDDDSRSMYADSYVAAVAKELRLPIAHFSWTRGDLQDDGDGGVCKKVAARAGRRQKHLAG